MKKYYYCIQVGADFSTYDYCSTVKRKAISMAKHECKNPANDGLQIRVQKNLSD